MTKDKEKGKRKERETETEKSYTQLKEHTKDFTMNEVS